MAFIIVVGNAISTSILLSKRFRKRPHYLLTSLAIADLVVGLLAVPLYIIVADPEQKILPGVRYDCVDMFTGKSSMFTLAVVSLERLHAIAQPQAIDLGSLYHGYSYSLDSFIYGHINSGVATFLCLDKEGIRHRCYHQLINATAATCFAYCLIWRKQSSSIHNNEVRARNDARRMRTSIIITVTFVFSWPPFEILTIVASLCISCQNHSYLVKH